MRGAFEHFEELPAPDRRAHSRQAVRTIAYVELDEGNGGIVLNASEGGLSVQAVMGLMEDSLPKMRFQLSESKDWLETGARVVWANESRKVAGLQFVELPEEARLHIRDWLAGDAGGAEPNQATTADYHEAPTVVREIKAPAAAPPYPRADGAAETARPAPSMHVFGQTQESQTNSWPLTSVPPDPDRKRSDRAWNRAGLAAVLAILSLVAGWIVGHGTLESLWRNVRRTASSPQAAPPDLAPPPVAASGSEPISEIETVDIHNQHWTIPFTPAAGGHPASPRGQVPSEQWPASNPALATPKIQSRIAGDGTGSEQLNPPVIAAPSDNGSSIPLPTQSPDPRDIAPPAVGPEPRAAQPAGALNRPVLIYHVNPVYPELAREQGAQGTVKLEVTIGTNGIVRSVIALSGPGLLVEAARSAVRQWRYTPSLLNGKPVESQINVSVVFHLPSSP
jgi:TonB family protein